MNRGRLIVWCMAVGVLSFVVFISSGYYLVISSFGSLSIFSKVANCREVTIEDMASSSQQTLKCKSNHWSAFWALATKASTVSFAFGLESRIYNIIDGHDTIKIYVTTNKNYALVVNGKVVSSGNHFSDIFLNVCIP